MDSDTDLALSSIRTELGPLGIRDAGHDLTEFTSDWTGQHRGACALVALPKSTREVSFVLSTCFKAGLAVVPQGGNTGLCGGATPDLSGKQVLINMRRMNRVRSLDDRVAVVEAGVILENLHNLVESRDRFFPLSLGAKGSCQIGGNIATNAGGLNVLRYGTMRHLVLGLEVVLPDGRILDTLTPLHKDNTGYDLKQWFIGSEGSLGVVTAASLRLFPNPKYKATGWVGLHSLEAVMDCFGLFSDRTMEYLSSFELIAASAVAAARTILGEQTVTLDSDYPWYVLVELSTADASADLETKLTSVMEDAIDKGLITDGSIATSVGQREAMWKTRESITEGQGATLRHDVSVPISRMNHFVAALDVAVKQLCPNVTPITYGHVGDGNLHYNLPRALLGQEESDVSTAIYDVTASFNGSFSAEHGVGVQKMGAFQRYKDPLAQELMLGLKRGIDPRGIMNPNILFG